MKNITLFFFLAICTLSFSQEYTEKEINDLARDMSASLENTKTMNSDIIIKRIYSSKRDIITVYEIPADMELSENNVKKERLEQLQAFGGDVFYNNKINLELWFLKNNIMYKRVRINYYELGPK
ncbi:MAG: hypothetical protein Q8O62_05960 [Aequorivita sp.]|nr:hypothetical protein [Aequorivita sp.]